MLSRLVLVSKNATITIPKFSINFPASMRLASTQVTQSQQSPVIAEGPERDLVNFPRPVRRMYGSPVRFGFIPEEWFQFFYKKTGVTGPYAFGTGLLTYLFSKEILVTEHEFFTGLALAIIFVTFFKKFGKQIGAAMAKEVDAYEDSLNEQKNNAIRTFERGIAEEKKAQWQAEGQKYLFDAKRENVHLQLESEYRRRLMNAYEEVKKRLDYQLEMQNISRKFQHKHMVEWIVNNVIKSITPEQEKQVMQKCFDDLKTLAVKAQ